MEPTLGPPSVRCLVVVRRDQPELLDHLRRHFGDDPEIAVLGDRRQGSDRRRTAFPVPEDRRRGERRRAELALHLGRVTLAPTPRPAAPGLLAAEPALAAAARSDERARLLAWVERGPAILGALETLLAQRRALGGLVTVLEERRGRLSAELASLRREQQRLLRERTAVLDAISRLLAHLSAQLGVRPPSPPESARRGIEADGATLLRRVQEASARIAAEARDARQVLEHAPQAEPLRPVTSCPRCGARGRGVALRACLVCGHVRRTAEAVGAEA